LRPQREPRLSIVEVADEIAQTRGAMLLHAVGEHCNLLCLAFPFRAPPDVPVVLAARKT
jgi:hypothetical protein